MTSIQRAFDPLSGPHRTRNRRRNPLWRFRRLFFILGLLAIGGVGAVLYVFSQTDLPEDRFDEIAQTSYMCTADIALGCGPDNATALLSSPGEDRDVVTYDQLPENLINAVVATEDQSFFTHRGVDPRGITRAAYQYVRGQGVVQGGSTITQQYVKLAFNDSKRDLNRKMREAMRAIKLEQDLTNECAQRPDLGDKTPQRCAKEQILERYLNRAYFGRGAAGVQAAARSYFGIDAGQLSISQSAFIAGLLRNPNGADPETNPEEANRRRVLSIELMAEAGFITPDEAAAATADPLVAVPKRNREGLGEVRGAEYGTEYFVEEVRQQLEEIYPNGEWYTNGLRVYTTLNPGMQQAAYETIYMPREEDLKARGHPEMGNTWLDPANPLDPAASIVSVDEQGRVVAMVGGHDFQASEFNLATSKGSSARQAGSTFKPFALATAIEQGISAKSFYPAVPGTLRIDKPECRNNGKPWEVTGGSSAQYRYRDLIDALTISSNIVYAELVVDITPEQLRATALKMGIRSPLQYEIGGTNFTPCSLVLGTQGVPVIDMASAYSTFERAGTRLDPVMIDRIEDVNGNVVCWYPVSGTCTAISGATPPVRQGDQAIQPETARQVNYAMTQVVAKGTGKRAALADRPIAGKTGTTQNDSDAWFAGFTCDLTTVVWIGNPAAQTPMFDFRKPLPEDGQVPVDANGDPIDDPNWTNIEGPNFPTYLWHDYMARVTADRPPCEQLETQTDFPGTRYNQELSITTLPPCGVELDKYGYPKGGSPDRFVPVTVPAPEQPPTGQPDGGQGLPRQDPNATGQVGAPCVPVDQWQAQTTGTGPATTAPNATGDPNATTVTQPDPGNDPTSTAVEAPSTAITPGSFPPETVSIPAGPGGPGRRNGGTGSVSTTTAIDPGTG